MPVGVGGPPLDTILSLIMMMCRATFMGVYHRKQCRGGGGGGARAPSLFAQGGTNLSLN